jgi:hypothetical protein
VEVSKDNNIDLVTFDSLYLIIYQSSLIVLSNQSTQSIINNLSNHWTQSSTYPKIRQLIPSYHPIFQSINPSNYWSQSLIYQIICEWWWQYWFSNNSFRVSHNLLYIPGITKFELDVELNRTQLYKRWAMITKLN